MAEPTKDLNAAANAAIRAARSIVTLETAPTEHPPPGAAINSALRRVAGRGQEPTEEDETNG